MSTLQRLEDWLEDIESGEEEEEEEEEEDEEAEDEEAEVDDDEEADEIGDDENFASPRHSSSPIFFFGR